jgi:hypothetical protein
MALRLLRTLRLDGSDELVFPRAAAAGEWAVPGTFMFTGRDPAALAGKARMALRTGFLGIASFGWSTLAVVVEASPAERAAATALLAQGLLAHLGAPDLARATAAAEDEIAFAQSLAEPPVGTLVALARSVEDGALRERFRTLVARDPLAHDRAFAWLATVALAPDEPAGPVDLAALARGEA